jgi:BlaI family transcriptional regulator, penicillinase repressor
MNWSRLPAAELAVLEILWRVGQATIRQLTDELYPGGSTSDYATVQKLIERLEGKGGVRRDRSGFAHQFCPAVERSEVLDQQLRDVAERLCEGSLTPLLMHLVQGARLSKGDRDQLRQLLDQPAPRSKRKPNR